MTHRDAPLLLRALALSVTAALGTVSAFILVSGAEALFRGRGLSLFGPVWDPAGGRFGILAMMWATVLLGASSLCLGWTVSLGCCCALGGLVPKPLARALMGVLTLMSAVPTVVYGFAAVFLLVPLIREGLGGTGFCWLAAMLMVALQGVPTMTFVMDASVRSAVERTRLAAAALGMSRAEHLVWVALPLSRRAMLSAAVLGFGRAMGDALLPAMLAGNAVRFARSPLDPMRTLTSHIALVLSSDIGGGEHLSLLLAGAMLLIMCAAASLLARRMGGGSSS
ncbi:MAG: ABC transporter permease subunit [Synergistaceae bacterium]|nr:ABC transporter permease subunit [Synergistaceae bacterium]